METQLDDCYLRQPEPLQGCFLAMREHILQHDSAIHETLKYGMPFFCYQKQIMWYLWVQRKTQHPYLGVVMGSKIDHPQLVQGNRSRIKILPLDPTADLPWDTIDAVIQKSIEAYRQ